MAKKEEYYEEIKEKAPRIEEQKKAKKIRLKKGRKGVKRAAAKKPQPIQRARLKRKVKRVITKRREIIQRAAQPKGAVMMARVPDIKPTDFPMRPVSSSWIAELGYYLSSKTAMMVTLRGYGYEIYGISFDMFVNWFYAMSKGTFFNYRIRDKYTIARVR